MKKAMLLLSALALALMLPGATPATALADTSTDVILTAQLMVVNPGTVTINGNQVNTVGEIIQGVIVSAVGWEAVEGASIQLTHSSQLTVDWATGAIIKGKGEDRIVVVQGGVPILTGETETKMSGNIFSTVYHNGEWEVEGVGPLHDTEAKGKLTASLTLTQVAPGVYTYVGTATITGKKKID